MGLLRHSTLWLASVAHALLPEGNKPSYVSAGRGGLRRERKTLQPRKRRLTQASVPRRQQRSYVGLRYFAVSRHIVACKRCSCFMAWTPGRKQTLCNRILSCL